MKQSIYLHRPIIDTLRCYGEPSDVINKILEEAAVGKFDLMNKPPCPGRDGAGRYDIDITEPNYLELLEMYSPLSPKISIRRLIYWFVENEMYNELGWKQNHSFVDNSLRIMKNKISNALSELQRAKRYCRNNREQNVILSICEEIKKLQESIK